MGVKDKAIGKSLTKIYEIAIYHFPGKLKYKGNGLCI